MLAVNNPPIQNTLVFIVFSQASMLIFYVIHSLCIHKTKLSHMLSSCVLCCI